MSELTKGYLIWCPDKEKLSISLSYLEASYDAYHHQIEKCKQPHIVFPLENGRILDLFAAKPTPEASATGRAEWTQEIEKQG